MKLNRKFGEKFSEYLFLSQICFPLEQNVGATNLGQASITQQRHKKVRLREV